MKKKDDLREILKNYNKYNKNFNIPCIVHATNKENFLKILKNKAIKVNSESNIRNKLKDIHYELGLDGALFFSCGFQFNSITKDKNNFGFIFDKKLSNLLDIYNIPIIRTAYETILTYWKDNDPQVLDEIKDMSPLHKSLLNNNLINFSAWQIKGDIYSRFNNYKDKKKILRIIKLKISEQLVLNNTENYIDKAYRNSDFFKCEIIYKRNIKLNNGHLIGFFVKGNDKKILNSIKDFMNYSKKDKLILFDGNKKKVLKKL